MKPLDLIGKRFGALVVTERIGSKWGHSLWKCQCDCGTVCERTANQLTLNTMISCGCKTKEAQHLGFLKHGMKGTRLYRIWKAMKTRCYNPNIPYFKYYGGKASPFVTNGETAFKRSTNGRWRTVIPTNSPLIELIRTKVISLRIVDG